MTSNKEDIKALVNESLDHSMKAMKAKIKSYGRLIFYVIFIVCHWRRQRG